MWKFIKRVFSKKSIDEFDVIIYLMSLGEIEYWNIVWRSHATRYVNN